MSQRPEKYDSNLPRNLTYRKARKAFFWRNPLDGKEIPLGQIARRDAVAQAIEANHFIEKNYSPIALLEQLKGEHDYTVSDWIERYEVILQRRDLAANTYRQRVSQVAKIREELGELVLTKVTTRHIAEFLEIWISAGQNTTAGIYRSVLNDMFREAIVEGRTENNPVAPTRAPKITVERERIVSHEQFVEIRCAAERLPAWFVIAMDLALVTGQRREDVAAMRFSNIIDDHLQVTQIKTGMKIEIPLSLTLPVAGLRLGTVIDRCRLLSRCDFMISSGIRKNSPEGNLHPDVLTKNFGKARALSGIEFTNDPPTFHEIRSLAGRMFNDAYGKEFAQKLLGHKSEKMTDVYLDSRNGSFIRLKA